MLSVWETKSRNRVRISPNAACVYFLLIPFKKAWIQTAPKYVLLRYVIIDIQARIMLRSIKRTDEVNSNFSEDSFDIYHHQHHVVPLARISLTLSRHFSLSFITSGRSSDLHPVSLHSCWMYVRAGRPAFARPYVGVHRSSSLMSSSQLLQQCPACLVRLTWIVFVMGGRWPYSWCLVGCCCKDLFKIACL